MGAVFDVYNTVATSTKVLRPIRPVFDIVFWVLSAGMVYDLTFLSIQGEFRLYTFMLLVVGYLIYRVTVRAVIVESALFIVRVIRLTVRFLARIIYVLIGLPLIACARLFFALLKTAYRMLLAIENVVSQTIRAVFLVVTFPVGRYLKADRNWRKKLTNIEQGFWDWLSNLLKKNSGSVS